MPIQVTMYMKKGLLLFFCLMFLSIPAYPLTLEEKLNTVSNHMRITVFVEESIRGNSTDPLPSNLDAMDHQDIIRIATRGYSHALLYDGDGMAKLWIYNGDSKNFKRISPSTRIQVASAGEFKPKVKPSRIPAKIITKETPTAKPYKFEGYADKGVKANFSGVAYKENAFGFREPVSGISFANNFNSKSSPVIRPGAVFGSTISPRSITKELNEEKGLEFSAQVQGTQRKIMRK
jgi:hypothetical protein